MARFRQMELSCRGAFGGDRQRRGIGIFMIALALALSTATAVRAQVVDSSEQPWAENVSEAERTRAEEVFLRANELFEGALFAESADAYREAVAIWDHPAIHLNLAKTLILLQQPVEAYASLKEAVRYPDAHDSEGQYRWASDSLARLKGQLVEIEVMCEDEGAAVIIDGTQIFVGPGRATAYFLPGEHVVIAEKRGFVAFPQRLILAPGDREQVEIELLSLAEARAVTRPLPAWLPWAAVGTGLAVGISGGILRRQAGQNFTRFDDEFGQACPDGCLDDALPSDLTDIRSRGNLQNRLGISMLIAGGVIAVGGTALVFLNRPRRIFAERTFGVIPSLSNERATVDAIWRF